MAELLDHYLLNHLESLDTESVKARNTPHSLNNSRWTLSISSQRSHYRLLDRVRRLNSGLGRSLLAIPLYGLCRLYGSIQAIRSYTGDAADRAVRSYELAIRSQAGMRVIRLYKGYTAIEDHLVESFNLCSTYSDIPQ